MLLCEKMSRPLGKSPEDIRSAAFQRRISILLFFAVLAFGMIDIRYAFRVAVLVSLHKQRAEKAAALFSFSNKHSGPERGVVENDSNVVSTLLYPLLVFEEQSRPEFTEAARMDLSYAGPEEDLAKGLVTNCRVPFWTIPPAGNPFLMPICTQGTGFSLPASKPSFSRATRVLITEDTTMFGIGKC